MREEKPVLSQNDTDQKDPASDVATQERDQRRDQFNGFMRWVQRATLLVGPTQIVAGYVGHISQLYVIALASLMLYVAAAVARRLVRARRLNAAVYTFVGGVYVALALLPLVVAGLLPAVIMTNLVAVILVGLFVSPRLVLRMTVITAIVSILSLLFELWSPLSPLEVPIVSLFLVPLILVFAGYLVHLFANDLSQALAASRSYAVDLEQRVAERTRDLQTAAADLSYRSQEMEVANVRLEEARRRQEDINRELEAANERTRRRAAQLQAVAEVSQAITRLRDPEQLLPQVTRLISQHFGFYHVGIFLVDEAGRFAVLRAANSEGGGRMLARNHKLAVGAQGVVGYVTGVGEPRVALDVGADAVHFVNPDLPDTRSEVALPLRVGGQTIGALDVQSVEAGAFDEEDVAVLSTLADQVAIAIETARLFQQSQEALAEAEETQRRYLQQAWQGFLAQRPDLQFEYTLEGVTPALDVVLPTTRQAMEQGEPAILSEASAETGDGSTVRAALSVPIKLRGQVIGAIDLHEADEARTWTAHEIALVQAVADQMAQAVETARLSEQTQARAQREQLVGQITARMTGATSVQDVLQIGSEALGKALGVTRSRVRLQPQEEALS